MGDKCKVLKKEGRLFVTHFFTIFRYDDQTSEILAKACVRGAGLTGKIACISAPTAYMAIKKHFPEAKGKHYFSSKFFIQFLKFIYSEEATKFCEISTLLLTGTT